MSADRSALRAPRLRHRARRAHRAHCGSVGAVGVLAGMLLLIGGWFGVARVLVHQCAAIEGPLADLGRWLTLLREVPDCPVGTLAVAPGLPQGAVLLIALALPVVAAQVALGALGLGLIAVLRRAVAVTLDVLAAVLPDLAALTRAGVRVTERIGILVGHRVPPLPSGVPGVRHPLRGPPVAMV